MEEEEEDNEEEEEMMEEKEEEGGDEANTNDNEVDAVRGKRKRKEDKVR